MHFTTVTSVMHSRKSCTVISVTAESAVLVFCVVVVHLKKRPSTSMGRSCRLGLQEIETLQAPQVHGQGNVMILCIMYKMCIIFVRLKKEM